MEIGEDFTPSHDRVLRFSRNDLTQVQVVILGQDPYPQSGAATGRAFEVGGLTSWNSSFKQASLRNIVKLLYKTFNGELQNWSQIGEKIAEKKFDVLPPCELFKHWEAQGALLLNVYLTCKPNHPKSHRGHWIGFSRKVIEYVNQQRKGVYWFLWGYEAQRIVKDIHIRKSFTCDHPMICAPNKVGSFINCNCFAATRNLIDWLGTKK